MKLKTINNHYPVISLGAPHGIGYEIFLRSIKKAPFKNHLPVCIGSNQIIKLFIQLLKCKVNYQSIKPEELAEYKPNNKTEFLLINIDPNQEKITKLNSISNNFDGKISLLTISIAGDLISSQMFKSVVTLPVSKENIHIHDSTFFGHTEFFQEKWKQKQVFMTFISPKLKIILLTTHIPLNRVSQSITDQLLLDGIKTAHQLKEKLKLNKPIAVLGLNPHAGENGLLGNEDLKYKKVIDTFNKQHQSNIVGPMPSDTAFTDFNRQKYSLYIASYHDQGLIPFKMLAFKDGVNLSYGMKYIRTSVDHGTAIDLIGKKKASLESFINAYQLAIELSN